MVSAGCPILPVILCDSERGTFALSFIKMELPSKPSDNVDDKVRRLLDPKSFAKQKSKTPSQHLSYRVFPLVRTQLFCFVHLFTALISFRVTNKLSI